MQPQDVRPVLDEFKLQQQQQLPAVCEGGENSGKNYLRHAIIAIGFSLNVAPLSVSVAVSEYLVDVSVAAVCCLYRPVACLL